MKGVILAGGRGTRLQPATFAMNKHMVPILNRPMIMYPIETLMRFGIEDILIVSGGNHIGAFAEFLGDGSDMGVSLTYRVQKEAGGIAQALGLAKQFAGDEQMVVILGDNIFGTETPKGLRSFLFAKEIDGRANIWVKEVSNANRFGVLIEEKNRIIEKPKDIKKGWAVTGLYSYPPYVFDEIESLVPSQRGELEITDINNYFLELNRCDVTYMDPGDFWSDAGTPESLYEVSKWAYGK